MQVPTSSQSSEELLTVHLDVFFDSVITREDDSEGNDCDGVDLKGYKGHTACVLVWSLGVPERQPWERRVEKPYHVIATLLDPSDGKDEL